MPDEPAAYLITFTAYGERVHGDSRGTVDRRRRLELEHEPGREVFERSRLKTPPVQFDDRQRGVIAETVRSVCRHNGWVLRGLNVRTNHIHAVVSAAGVAPEFVMNAFKAWSTRRLRENGLAGASAKLWTRHGSTRYLWTEDDVVSALDYVLYGQGRELGGVRWDVEGHFPASQQWDGGSPP